MKEELVEILNKAIKNLTGEPHEVNIQLPNDLSKGDFTTNIAMRIGAKFGGPMEAGEKIVEEIRGNTDFYSRFSKIELVKPGFINFYLSGKEIQKQIELISKPSVSKKEEELILEFGDPNPFKEPHIGHLRNLVLGESLARLQDYNGAKLIRANYQGDVGMHVAKAIWGMQKAGLSAIEKESIEEKAKFLGTSYAAGAKAFEEDENAKKEISQINIKIYQKDSEVLKVWEKGRQWSLDYFEILYKYLGIKYDKYYFESQTEKVGREIVEKNSPKVFEKHDGALIFRGEKFGLHTRVFVTKEGYATYEGKDLALAVLKNKDFPNAQSLIMTANEQTDYFKVLLKALEMVDKKIADKTSHLPFGFVSLKEGKMSSRSGNIISAFWLIEETKKRLKKGFKEVSDVVLEDLGIGAVKWTMLKFSRESNISFSIDESVQIEGNSGPYMQYTYARTQSLLVKGSFKGSEAKFRENFEPEVLALARLVCQFETTAKDAAKSFSPNILSNYLFVLAQAFNLFYEKKKILGDPEEEERLMITRVTGEVLKKGLYLLGISTPEKI